MKAPLLTRAEDDARFLARIFGITPEIAAHNAALLVETKKRRHQEAHRAQSKRQYLRKRENRTRPFGDRKLHAKGLRLRPCAQPASSKFAEEFELLAELWKVAS